MFRPFFCQNGDRMGGNTGAGRDTSSTADAVPLPPLGKAWFDCARMRATDGRPYGWVGGSLPFR